MEQPDDAADLEKTLCKTVRLCGMPAIREKSNEELLAPGLAAAETRIPDRCGDTLGRLPLTYGSLRYRAVLAYDDPPMEHMCVDKLWSLPRTHLPQILSRRTLSWLTTWWTYVY